MNRTVASPSQIHLPEFVLASASPRRRELLSAAGYRFTVEPSRVIEPEPGSEIDVRRYVADLAFAKAWEVGLRLGGPRLVLAADTACAIDRQILNKPVDRADAERMIRLQEGRPIDVVTGVVLLRPDRLEWIAVAETSTVQLRTLGDAERHAYLDSGDWVGKAGGYGVQDEDTFVSVLTGSFSNVVGLPMERLASLMSEYPHLWDDLVAGR